MPDTQKRSGREPLTTLPAPRHDFDGLSIDEIVRKLDYRNGSRIARTLASAKRHARERNYLCAGLALAAARELCGHMQNDDETKRGYRTCGRVGLWLSKHQHAWHIALKHSGCL